MGNAINKGWWKNRIAYQVYPRSFCDANGDGTGDLKGITSKLDYLKELGVGIVWLSPVYRSPMDDGGYDISDYEDIDPLFGNMADMDELLAEAKKRDIKILMDLVVNHCSDEHPWFQKALREPDSEEAGYFWFAESPDGPPNNWRSMFGGSAWENVGGDRYYMHLFSKKQPDLNWENPRVREEIADMINYWLDMGVDGFRCDVINNISKDFSRPYAGGNGPRLHEFLHELHERALAPHGAYTVGETWGLSPAQALELTGEARGELTMTFQFEHLLLGRVGGDKFDPEPLDKKAFVDILSKWEYGLANDSYPVLVMENHDQPRALSRFGDRERYPYESATMLAALLYGMRGVPFIYQGQELGLHDPAFETLDEYRDIETLNAYRDLKATGKWTDEELLAKLQYGSRDCGRVPIPWDTSAHGGFTSGTPWIKTQVDAGFTVAEQEQDERSVLHFYRKLLALRKSEPCLADGTFDLLRNENDTAVYTRVEGNETVYVVCRFADTPCAMPDCVPRDASVLLANYGECGDTLLPYQALWLKVS